MTCIVFPPIAAVPLWLAANRFGLKSLAMHRTSAAQYVEPPKHTWVVVEEFSYECCRVSIAARRKNAATRHG
jgi:hypothetical protein